MKNLAVIAALVVSAVITGAFAVTSKAPVNPAPKKAASPSDVRMQSLVEACSFLRPGGPLESKPQSPDYRGGCLEYLPHVELESRASLALSLFTGASGDGSLLPKWSARAHYGGSMVRLQMEPVNVGAHPFGPVQFYKVRTEQGTDLCKDQAYDVVPESSDRLEASLLENLRGTAVAIPGYWEDKAWHPSAVNAPGATSFSLSCVSGAMAKCALWGYAPWAQRDGVSLEDFHVACVQAVRAKYLQPYDTSYTCRGTVIDIYDRLGILKKDSKNTSFRFESRWRKDGLDCLAESRFPICMKDELATLGMTATGGECTDPDLTGWPAGVLIAVRSSPSNRVVDPHETQRGPVCPNRLEDGCDQTRR